MEGKLRFENQKVAMRVSGVSIGVNLGLFALKLCGGVFGRSAAMVSDAVHSLSDVVSTFVVIVGIKLGAKQADGDHCYGHERLESIAALLLAWFLAVVGFGIGAEGIANIINYDGVSYSAPSAFALAAAVVSIVVKEWMFRYGKSVALRLNSDALMADAWHHRSDALSSVGSLLGIGGAMAGFPILDPLAAVVICLFILKAAYGIFKEATDKLVDRACDSETVERMKNAVEKTAGVIAIDLIQTRLFGSRVYVDIEISADKDLSLVSAHGIAQAVHDNIEREFPIVKHCMVHVNPK